MEVEAHAQLVAVRAGVTDAVFQRGGGHLPYRDHAVNAACLHQFLQIPVHIAAIGVKTAAIAFKIVFIDLRLGDHVDHIESEPLDALGFPEAQDVGHFFPHSRILPVQVCLHHIIQVQIPLAQPGHILPCRPAELGHPVGGIAVRGAVLEDVVVLVFLIPGQRFLEPHVLGGGMVEHHVQHQTDAALICFPDQLFQIFHRPVAGVDGAVVRHVIAVIPLRRGKERGQPEHIHTQVGQIVQLAGNAFQVAKAVPVGIAERLRIDLVHNFIFEISHSEHTPFLKIRQCPSSCQR